MATVETSNSYLYINTATEMDQLRFDYDKFDNTAWQCSSYSAEYTSVAKGCVALHNSLM